MDIGWAFAFIRNRWIWWLINRWERWRKTFWRWTVFDWWRALRTFSFWWWKAWDITCWLRNRRKMATVDWSRSFFRCSDTLVTSTRRWRFWQFRYHRVDRFRRERTFSYRTWNRRLFRNRRRLGIRWRNRIITAMCLCTSWFRFRFRYHWTLWALKALWWCRWHGRKFRLWWMCWCRSRLRRRLRGWFDCGNSRQSCWQRFRCCELINWWPDWFRIVVATL